MPRSLTLILLLLVALSSTPIGKQSLADAIDDERASIGANVEKGGGYPMVSSRVPRVSNPVRPASVVPAPLPQDWRRRSLFERNVASVGALRHVGLQTLLSTFLI